jgi:hypothetical protein
MQCRNLFPGGGGGVGGGGGGGGGGIGGGGGGGGGGTVTSIKEMQNKYTLLLRIKCALYNGIRRVMLRLYQ